MTRGVENTICGKIGKIRIVCLEKIKGRNYSSLHMYKELL